MSGSDFLKRQYIRFCRYGLRKKFLPVMAGPLKGCLWSTQYSYEYLLGTYEDPALIGTFDSWLKPDSVFYDLGANIGFYSLLANRIIITGKIYAFEPSSLNRAVFEEHLRLNIRGAHRIQILPFAITDREKELLFTDEAIDGNTYLTSSPVYAASKNRIRIKGYSLDGLLQLGYEKPDIIKIDVEGAELDVLKGAVETIRTCRPRILLATHDCHLPGVKEECIRYLQDLGYTLQHTGRHNKQLPGLDDYIALPSPV
ncbi:MAG: FkbM family methyltransferase [Chitinophagaceae bacterium]|nr:FkbM family methyltransferase [Chitinophagaceae bacterium]